MTRIAAPRLLSLALASALAVAQPASAQQFDPFTVADIRVEGLQRITAGTVFSYLPVERGDLMDRNRAGIAIRALFRTGFFNDVRLERQGDILVITVEERPAINKITLVGNKDIKTDDLMRGLRDIGLAEGETFDRLNLERVTRELTRQYNNRGKYNVSIRPSVTQLDRNRVDITIDIKEGKAARIRHINIVGNQNFEQDEIRKSWESNTSNWLSWYRRDDQYSREKLSGDLEKLNAFYLDRGYVDFNIESTQVSISPDNRDMFITANIAEGEVYTVSSIEVTGETILPHEEISKLVFLQPGMTFSRSLIEFSSDAIVNVLSNIGYAFARVSPIPEVDRENRTIAIRMFVEPGQRVQVRRIVFRGNNRTSDEVLRREMRQFEGSWYSQAAIDRSKVRLQRLGFFETVDIETPEVPGTADQVDVVVNVKERQSGQLSFGLGYSQLAGLITSVQLSQDNFLGTGNRIAVAVQNNVYSRRFDFSYFDPYFTDEGVSVGYNVRYSEFNRGDFNVAQFTTDNGQLQAVFGLPITETDSVGLSIGIDRNDITTVDGLTPPSLIQYMVDTMGDRARFPVFCLDEDDDPDTPCVETPGDNRKWRVNAWRSELFWSRDSRNHFFVPTRGTIQRLGAEVALPGSDLEYWKLSYQYSRYWPISRALVLNTNADIGWGRGYGNTRGFDLPFFENFYAGGTRSVRGFEDNTLGPCEFASPASTRCQSVGGSFKTVGGVELIFPTLFDTDSARVSAFLDVGNVFRNAREFDSGDLRASVGMALQWQAPIGPIIISYAYPIRKEEGDRLERLQFTFGTTF